MHRKTNRCDAEFPQWSKDDFDNVVFSRKGINAAQIALSRVKQVFSMRRVFDSDR
ncbi:MAG: hypothetical protein RR244_03945 [Oscillospiraceae bacterium]